MRANDARRQASRQQQACQKAKATKGGSPAHQRKSAESGKSLAIRQIAYEYDLNGNVRRSLATYHALDSDGNASTVTSPQDFWYRYDARGQVVQGKAALVGGVITGGIGYSYDVAGRRVLSAPDAGHLLQPGQRQGGAPIFAPRESYPQKSAT
ncbi:hypothetical protein [Sphingosinicella sp.]|uniref:hypothetical protein n=1 Tax=Sphingosinicella sp. TaxID=1917971 RepID=UPI0040377791